MELNKIAAAILLAGLIGMITGKVSTILYDGGGGEHHGGEAHEIARGYVIEGADAFADGAAPMAAGSKEEKLASIIPLLHTADVAAGESFFAKKCTTCHTVEKGGAAKTGPNLWGIVNRDIGSASGFNYSKTLSEAEGNWEYEQLNAFLHKPKKHMPGTIMAFAGISKDQDRADVIAYLRSMSDGPAPIPAAPVEEPEEEAAPAAAEAAPAESGSAP